MFLFAVKLILCFYRMATFLMNEIKSITRAEVMQGLEIIESLLEKLFRASLGKNRNLNFLSR